MGFQNSTHRPARISARANGLQLEPSGERYTVHRRLGHGGMATVSEATEVATGRSVALKRLHTQGDPVKQQRNAELFAREFHVLSQLEHPRIVKVYDYGNDTHGAYYTMELLSGGDLQEFAPVPWRSACGIARDICSALSLLHSRRLVHRDVSPRNVRRNHDGPAKLIDFGASAAMGANKLVVGTPPCCAPETLQLLPLDGRTDLFALGATLYYALVGHHAYMAHHFSMLQDAWQAGFAPPSQLNPEIPEALSNLVIELLRLEPDARPSSAAEVIQRLCAIDGEPATEQLQVAQAYLSMPTLVGREEALARVRRKLERLGGSRVRLVVIEGAAGVGRSRFLDACLLEATLLGVVCARADADDASSGDDYAVLRALARQLVNIMPAATREAARPHMALLARVLPELEVTATQAVQTQIDDEGLRPQLQAAVQAWLTTLSQHRRLMLAVDDFHRIDEPSAALLSLLPEALPHSFCLLTSCESGAAWASPSAQKLVLETATRIPLERLSYEEAGKLLKSLFGDVPNVEVLAHRLHALASGNPRDLLHLAHHVVDRGVARYEAGVWTLPERVDSADLPGSMAQALLARIAALSASARDLAVAMALCADQTFSFDECCSVVECGSESALRCDLDELVKVDMVRCVEEKFGLSNVAWALPLRSMLTPEREQTLHGRLAELLLLRGQDFRASQHFLRAGQHDRGLDALVAHATASQAETNQSSDVFLRYVRSLPPDWFDTYVLALRLCEEEQRPSRDEFVLRGRLSGLLPAFALPGHEHVAILIDRLKHDSGLDDWKAFETILDPKDRITRAMEHAYARHQSTPERLRVFDPVTALTLLARAVGVGITRVALDLDLPAFRTLPTLAPFVPVSPAVAIMTHLVDGVDARYAGHSERARSEFLKVLALAPDPGSAEDNTSYRVMRQQIAIAITAIDACMGLGSDLEDTDQSAMHPAHHIAQVQSRLLHHLYQGDIPSADACKKQIERLRVHTFQLYDNPLMVWEIGAPAIAEDLTRIRQIMEQVAPLAPHHTAWRIVHHYACAEYHRARRDPAKALNVIEHALALVVPGQHPLWASIATNHVRSLGDLGRHDEALAAAESYVLTAQQMSFRFTAEPLWLALSVCRGRAGRSDAGAIADAVIERLAALGVRGLHLGLAHETRARVAMSLNDEATFRRHADFCGAIYGRHRNPALRAKHRRLEQDAERLRGVTAHRLSSTPDSYAGHTATRVTAALEHCRGGEQRSRLALTLLLQQSGANAGLLFTIDTDEAVCSATIGNVAPATELLAKVAAYLAAQLEHAMTTSDDDKEEPVSQQVDWHDASGRNYQPVLLSHSGASGFAVTAVALLVLPPSAPLRYPAEVASAISRFFSESGDTSLLMLAD